MKQQISDLKEEISDKDAKLDKKKINDDEMKSTQTYRLKHLAGADSDQMKKDLQEQVDNLEKKLLASEINSKKKRNV